MLIFPLLISFARYTEKLLTFAKENVNFVRMLERRWCELISDRTTPSCQLKPMARAIRTIVHEYSDTWKLHTCSYDPEPRRYISCVKMRDTQVPKMLLSEAARAWDGRPLPQTSEAEPAPSVPRRSSSPPPNSNSRPRSSSDGRSRVDMKKEIEAKSDPRFQALFKKSSMDDNAGESVREPLKLDPSPRTKSLSGEVSEDGKIGVEAGDVANNDNGNNEGKLVQVKEAPAISSINKNRFAGAFSDSSSDDSYDSDGSDLFVDSLEKEKE